MEPRIQYAKTSDGVSIAYWTMGEGEPILHTPLLFSHLQREWNLPESRRWYESLARMGKLVGSNPTGPSTLLPYHRRRK